MILVFTAAWEGHDTTDAKSYCKILQSRGYLSAILTAFSKFSGIWRDVCNSGDFETQALVCTSVLDCGVSSHNTNPDNLVVADVPGKHLYHENVYKHFKAAVKKSDFPT